MTAVQTASTFYEAADLLFLYTETPLHAGTGASLGIVDLPIQREVHTQYPMIQGSSVKGALRSRAEQSGMSRDQLRIIFGPDGKDDVEAHEHAGSLIVGDARTLLFPVRSLEGVFHYVTSADALARFVRDGQRAGAIKAEGLLKGVDAPTEGNAWVASADKKEITLEEFTYSTQYHTQVTELANILTPIVFPAGSAEANYWQRKLSNSIVVLPNTDFRDFTLYATQVVQRIRLDSATKTVSGGGLWSEECLPSDTLMYAPVFATHPRQGNGANGGKPSTGQKVLEEVKNLFKTNNYIQLGGDETVGYGQVSARFGNN